MIIGIGTDLVQIPRIEQVFAKYGHKFLVRILSKREQNKFNKLSHDKKIAFLAKRFAGKEAVSKAIGTGIGSYLKFSDMEIDNDGNGKPIVKILSSKLSKDQALKIDISLSDDYPTAVAFAIAST